jgi:putative membrane protein
MRYVVAIFWLIIIVLAIVFVALNSNHIELNYYTGKKTVYLPVLLFVTLVVGAILGILAMVPVWLRAKRERRRMRGRLRDAEQELKNLRNIPIKDTH